MANPTRSMAFVLLEEYQANFFNMVTLYDHLSSGDMLLPMKRTTVPRVQHFMEVTIPQYTLDDFKTHFRLSRRTCQTTCLRSLSDYNQTTGPVPDVEKDVLMYLWFIG
jgi:hypothetical protein